MPSKSSAPASQYADGINAYERLDGMILTADTRTKAVKDPVTGVTKEVPLSHYGMELDKILRENPQEWGPVGFWSDHDENGTYEEGGVKRPWFVFDEKGRGHRESKRPASTPA